MMTEMLVNTQKSATISKVSMFSDFNTLQVGSFSTVLEMHK